MGVRGEVFSTRLILPNRTYFLNVKENRLGDFYLNIVESKNKETGGFERQSVIVFADDLPAFLGEFDKSLKALEKAVRDRKRDGGKKEYSSGTSAPDLASARRARFQRSEGSHSARGSGHKGNRERNKNEKRVTVRKRERP
jgi:hypothetical protein